MACAAFVPDAATAGSSFAVRSSPQRVPLCGRARLAGAAAAPHVARQSAARMSLIPLVPNWLALGAWLYGGYRFYGGFRETNYQQNYKVPLSVLWPVFLVFNKKYRANFQKALKAPKD